MAIPVKSLLLETREENCFNHFYYIMIIKELSRFILIINKFIYYEQIQIDIYGLKINWVLKIFLCQTAAKIRQALPEQKRSREMRGAVMFKKRHPQKRRNTGGSVEN